MASLSHLIELLRHRPGEDVLNYLEEYSTEERQHLLSERDDSNCTAVHFGAKFLSSEVSAVRRCNETSSNYISLRH